MVRSQIWALTAVAIELEGNRRKLKSKEWGGVLSKGKGRIRKKEHGND